MGKNIMSMALILGACVVIGDKLWTIALAAAMIAGALALTVRKHGKASGTS